MICESVLRLNGVFTRRTFPSARDASLWKVIKKLCFQNLLTIKRVTLEGPWTTKVGFRIGISEKKVIQTKLIEQTFINHSTQKYHIKVFLLVPWHNIIFNFTSNRNIFWKWEVKCWCKKMFGDQLEQLGGSLYVPAKLFPGFYKTSLHFSSRPNYKLKRLT
jgi:hypothetical protein